MKQIQVGTHLQVTDPIEARHDAEYRVLQLASALDVLDTLVDSYGQGEPVMPDHFHIDLASLIGLLSREASEIAHVFDAADLTDRTTPTRTGGAVKKGGRA